MPQQQRSGVENADETEAAFALSALAYPETAERLTELRELAAEGNIRFGKPLSDGMLNEWERQQECTLPQEYRLLLQFVGNGVFGNDGFIVLPLPADEQHSCNSAIQPFDLFVPFPLTADWPNSRDRSPYVHVLSGRENFQQLKGCLRIRGEADTNWYLVVRGAEPGAVWRYDMSGSFYRDYRSSICYEDTFLLWCVELLEVYIQENNGII